MVAHKGHWRRWAVATVLLASVTGASALDLSLPNRTGSFKFAIIGDFGTGERPAYEVAAQMAATRLRFPFDTVVMVGDNIIGSGTDPSDVKVKFERPFRPLLDAGVRFYAALGNHDLSANRHYLLWNMQGRRYYTFAKQNVRFFVLDSNRLDRSQLSWFEQTLRASTDRWRICILHHPLYSDGVKHGPDLELRVMLEPLLVQYGIDVVFSGHDHVYQRLKPQKGVHYFVTGPAGQEPRELRPSDATAAAFDRDYSFMIIEVTGDELRFQTVSRTGASVDAGVITPRQKS